MSKTRDYFRYYFIRKKSPISYIFWRDILKREMISSGLYNVNIATEIRPDCAITLETGTPKENMMSIHIFDKDDELIDTVDIKLSYRSVRRIHKGFREAYRISLENIRKEER